MNLTFAPVETLSIVCGTVAGLVFLVTGGIRALSPSTFYSHMERLKLMPYDLLRVVIGGTAFVQCTLGIALIFRLYPTLTFPIALALMVTFALFTAWSGIFKRTNDCGCYGGLISMTPAKSVLLDVAYIALIVVAWQIPVSFGWSPAVERSLLVDPALVFASVSVMSSWVFLKWGEDMVTLSLLQVNRPWNAEWFEGYSDSKPETHQLIVFMGETCSVCKQWIGPLNKIAQRDDMPQVIAGMATDPETLQTYITENGIAFPLLRVKDSTMDRLVKGFPTVVEIEAGVIASRNEGFLPPHLVSKLKETRQSRLDAIRRMSEGMTASPQS